MGIQKIDNNRSSEKDYVMEYNARVCNHKYIQHEGEARGLYVLVVTHECIILIQPSLGCINWFVAQYTQVQDECRQCVVISATTGQIS